MSIRIRTEDRFTLEPVIEDARTASALARAFVKIEKIFDRRSCARLEVFRYPDSSEIEYHIVIDPGPMDPREAVSRLDRLCEWWESYSSHLSLKFYPVFGNFERGSRDIL